MEGLVGLLLGLNQWHVECPAMVGGGLAGHLETHPEIFLGL